MNIVIPIGQKRFYYNRKINCLPAEGSVRYGDLTDSPASSRQPGLAGLGARRLGVPQLLELGQRLGLPAGRAQGGPEPGLRLWRYFCRHGELP